MQAIAPLPSRLSTMCKGKQNEEIVKCAVEINAKAVAADRTTRSKVLAEQQKAGKKKSYCEV